MGLESATYVSELNSSNPVGATDPKSQGDNHLRLIKSALLATFPGANHAIYLDTAFADIASAGTTAIGGSASNYVRITGTTTITSFGTVASGIWRFIRFAAALTLTHNATSLILPGGANITTAAGDCALAVSEGSGNWRVLWYTKADGTPVVTGSSITMADLTNGDSWTAEASVASATTCDILGAASDWISITGTTTITSFGTGTNKIKFVRFTGALTLTHNATSLILPGGANITTAAGDTCIVISDGSSNARVYGYQKASGVAVVSSGVTQIVQQEFTASGTYTPTTNMKYCIVEMVGGGGAGGAANDTGDGGGGGGAGEYARGIFSAAAIGASQTVTIGTAGNTTSLGALLTAAGGSAGDEGSSSADGGAGGTGGTGTGVHRAGAKGSRGGTNETGGDGASSPFGGGGGGRKGSNGSGNAGSGRGSGGGGAASTDGTNQSGGAGTSGYVLITEYI